MHTSNDLIHIEINKMENGYRISRFETITNIYDGIGEYVNYSIENGLLTLKNDKFSIVLSMSNVILKINE